MLVNNRQRNVSCTLGHSPVWSSGSGLQTETRGPPARRWGRESQCALPGEERSQLGEPGGSGGTGRPHGTEGARDVMESPSRELSTGFQPTVL